MKTTDSEGTLTRKQFLGWEWETPKLLPGSEQAAGVGRGFLTPTPLWGESTLFVFGGVRDSGGVSRICRLEYDPASLTLVGRSRGPVLDVGEPGQFDEHGVILGDLVCAGDLIVMAYIGFQRLDTTPFRAHTGIAVARSIRDVFRRAEDPSIQITDNPTSGGAPSVQAVHSIRFSEGSYEAMFSEGSSWEVIRGNRYPRYSSYAAGGPGLRDLQAEGTALLPHPQDVYRLGRPRWIQLGGTPEYVVATGMSRDQIYRPFLFAESSDGSYEPVEEPFLVAPGDYPWCKTQVSYPSLLANDDRAILFINGDAMGAAGAYYLIGHRS